jgi:nuclear transport factor 2 (NTF2) superfamily protein
MPIDDLSEDAVRNALARYQVLFARADVEGILEDFADDVRVRYASFAPFTGKAKLRDMLQRRFATMRDYQLTKRLEFVSAPRIASSWTGSWVDVATGNKMELYGLEILTVRHGKFSEWSASVSSWRLGESARL